METITVNVDEELAAVFRKKAEEKFSGRKGYLQKAVSEAFKKWVKESDDLAGEAAKIMDKGIILGLGYRKRSELYEGTD